MTRQRTPCDLTLDGFGNRHVAQREHLTLLLGALELVERRIDRGAIADHRPHRLHPVRDCVPCLGTHRLDLVAPELHRVLAFLVLRRNLTETCLPKHAPQCGARTARGLGGCQPGQLVGVHLYLHRRRAALLAERAEQGGGLAGTLARKDAVVPGLRPQIVVRRGRRRR